MSVSAYAIFASGFRVVGIFFIKCVGSNTSWTLYPNNDRVID